MIIGLDGKRAVSNMTGLGNYSRLVLEELSGAFPDVEMHAYTPRLRDNARLATLRQRPNVRFELPVKHPLEPAAVWRTWGLPAQLRNDGVTLYHGLSNELPLSIRKAGIPSVVTVHDVIYRTMPECYSVIDRKLYDWKYGCSCRFADRVIAISECTKRDIMRFYGVPEEKIDVIYQGCAPQFKRQWSDTEKEDVRRRLALPLRYIVQVGTIERRKNLELTLRALPWLPEELKLVVVGRATPYLAEMKKLAEELRVADRIRYIHDTAFADLPGICQCAEAIAYPSRYEGFGLPVIEGLESGRPVIAATGSCLEEAGGDAAIYVAPDDVRGMAEALRAATDGTLDLGAMRQRAARHTARFDTSRMAENIAAVYARLGVRL